MDECEALIYADNDTGNAVMSLVSHIYFETPIPKWPRCLEDDRAAFSWKQGIFEFFIACICDRGGARIIN